MNIALELAAKIKRVYPETDIQELCGQIEEVINKYDIKLVDAGERDTNKTKDIIDYFISCKKSQGCTNGTINNYKTALYPLLEDVSEHFEMININQIRIHISKLIDINKSTTASNKAIIIKTFFKWCNNEGYFNNHPSRIRIPKAEKSVRRSLSVVEVEALRNACNTKRERALIEFLLSTGCRVSEINTASMTDVLTGKAIIKGKGNVERVVYVNEKAMFYIKAYIDERAIDTNILFTTTKGEVRPIGVRNIQKIIAKVGERAEIHVFPHKLRHSLATGLLKNGASITSIQEVLGHSSVITTQNYAKTDRAAVEYEHHKYSNL